MNEDRVLARRPLLGFAIAFPIGILSGLIGLGGAELRLPALLGPMRYNATQAAPLNLAVSLATVAVALATRAGSLRFAAVAAHAIEIAGLIAGAVAGAAIVPGIVRRVADRPLEAAMAAWLFFIGVLVLVETASGRADASAGFVGNAPIVRVVSGFAFGAVIGSASALLGVAGNELLIPTLLFAFGLGVKAAGTAALVVSIPAVLTGVLRYRSMGAFRDRDALKSTVFPMAFGSVLGAVLGGIFVAYAPALALKYLLGLIILGSAIRIAFRLRRHNAYIARPL